MNRFCIVPPRLRGRPPLHNSWTSRLTRVSLFTGENFAITREVSRARENHRDARSNIGTYPNNLNILHCEMINFTSYAFLRNGFLERLKTLKYSTRYLNYSNIFLYNAYDLDM